MRRLNAAREGELGVVPWSLGNLLSDAVVIGKMGLTDAQRRKLSPDLIECLICSRGFIHLGSHLRRAHGISVREYLLAYQIPRGFHTCTDQMRSKLRERALKHDLIAACRASLTPEILQKAAEKGVKVRKALPPSPKELRRHSCLKTKQPDFIQHLRETGSVTESRLKVGLKENRVYVWRKRDQHFRNAWDRAIREWKGNVEELDMLGYA